MNRLLILGVVGLGVSGGVSVPARAEENIWAEDLKAAQSHLQDVERRAATAGAAKIEAENVLPALELRARELRTTASRREQRAADAQAIASRKESRVDEQRRSAAEAVAQADNRHADRMLAWRSERATWITVAATLVAAGIALGLLAVVSRQREHALDEQANKRLAARVALGLGASVTALLCGLVALHAAEMVDFSLWLVAAALVAVAAPCAAVAAAWRRFLPRGPRYLVPTVAALVAAGAGGPVAAAVATDSPARDAIPPDVAALARAHYGAEPPPAAVRAAIARADRLADAASAAAARASSEQAKLDETNTALDQATRRLSRAEASVERWSREVDRIQAEYDSYQALIDEGERLDDELDALLEEDEPLQDLEDPPGYSPPPPTTEDFGSGSGSIGFCRDGTVSDSIGRPGACSYHGGVAP